MTTERIWDFTALDTFLTCHRKFYWRMVRHLTPKTVSPALDFGKCIHSALETYYTQGMEKALEVFSEGYVDREWDPLRTIANGLKLLENYAKVYPKEPFKVVGKPETGFVFPIGDYLWGGRIDLPIEWSGDLYVMEHKTTSSLRANYFKQFELNMQVSSYVCALEEYLGRKCVGCIINVLEPWKELIRPTSRSKKTEDHYARLPVSRSQRQKDEFKLNVQRIIEDIHRCHNNNEWYPTEHACFNYNTNCPYKDLCLYGEDPRTIERDFVEDEWKPYKETINER